MVPEHYIEWIALVTDKTVERVYLAPGEEPKAVFDDVGEADVYEYCNLHGLWKASKIIYNVDKVNLRRRCRREVIKRDENC